MPLWGRKPSKGAAKESSELLEWWPAPIPVPRVPNSDAPPQLVFVSEQERERQQRACEIKVLEGCTKGLRAGCSLQAARQCSPPGLLSLLGLAPQRSWEERETCQQACMSACLQQQQPACERHALNFCADAFAGPVGEAPQARTTKEQHTVQQRRQQ